MSQIKEYDIIEANTEVGLKEKIKNAISEGWIPFGSVTIVPINVRALTSVYIVNCKYLQAIIKYASASSDNDTLFCRTQKVSDTNSNFKPTFNADAQIYDTM